MDRRRPGSHDLLQRKESDKAIILSGVFEGKTTGHQFRLFIMRIKDLEITKR